MEKIFKRLLKLNNARGRKVLDTKNDPFLLTPARVRDAKWIAKIWAERVNEVTYDRGFHYMLVSWKIKCPWGEKRKVHSSPYYMNVDSDFNHLATAIRDARNWGLLPWDMIEDHKHVGLEKWVDFGQYEGNRQLKPFEQFDGYISHKLDLNIPEIYTIDEAEIYDDDFEDIKNETVEDVLKEYMTGLTAARYQPYYVAVVSEKSGLRKVAKTSLDLLKHGFDFLNFEGQASTTVVRDFIYNRLLSNVPPEHPIRKKKIRIFYLSDFDYAGRTMVPAFIQKLLFTLWASNISLDIKIKPLALTRQIIKKYDLPPAPVPIRELGAKTLQDRWLTKFGRIVEIDSLVTLHKGVLEAIIVDELSRYIDLDLAKTVNEKLNEVENEAAESIKEALDEDYEEWLEAKKNLSKAMAKMNEAIAQMNINETLKELKDKIAKLATEVNLDELVIKYQDLFKTVYVDYEPPELDLTSDYEVDEEGDWLFDSKRDAIKQAEILKKYKP